MATGTLQDYQQLIRLGTTSSLYRHLGAPGEEVAIEDVFEPERSATKGIVSSKGRWGWTDFSENIPSREEIRRDRLIRISAFRAAAAASLALASEPLSAERRAALENAARTNLALAETLQAMLDESVNVDAEWKRLENAHRLLAEERGRATFERLEPSLRERLCEEWHACEKIRQFEDEASLAMAVGDALVGLATSAPIATLAALVVKIGIKRFCNCHA